jgi:sugar phosphate permease
VSVASDHKGEPGRDRPLQRERFSVLLTASLVSSLIMLDSNIVAVSLPAIGRSLSASFTDIQWVISAYVLTYAALLLAAGSYADLHGRRKAMLIGLVVFAAASAACGIAATSLMLNLARAVQGIGGAFLLTASLAIISAEFTGEARARLCVLGREPRDRPGCRSDHRRRHYQCLRLALDFPGQRACLRIFDRGHAARRRGIA